LTIEEGMMTFPTHWHPVVEITILGGHGWKGARRESWCWGRTWAPMPMRPCIIPKARDRQVPLDVLVGRREC